MRAILSHAAGRATYPQEALLGVSVVVVPPLPFALTTLLVVPTQLSLKTVPAGGGGTYPQEALLGVSVVVEPPLPSALTTLLVVPTQLSLKIVPTGGT